MVRAGWYQTNASRTASVGPSADSSTLKATAPLGGRDTNSLCVCSHVFYPELSIVGSAGFLSPTPMQPTPGSVEGFYSPSGYAHFSIVDNVTAR